MARQGMIMLTAIAALVVISVTAFAQDKPIDCAKAMSTYEMNYCADRELAKADAQLNEVYRKALAKVAASTQPKPYDAKHWEAALRASQRAWVQFRDADCKGLVPMGWSGGTGTTGEVLGCMTEKTEARVKELKDRFELQ